MTDPRSGDRHAETPLTVRFSEDRQRLEDYAAATGTPIRRVVRDAVKHWLDKDTDMWVAYDSTSCDVLADGHEFAIRKYRELCALDEDGTICIAPESEWKRVAVRAAKEMSGNPPRRYPSGIEHLGNGHAAYGWGPGQDGADDTETGDPS